MSLTFLSQQSFGYCPRAKRSRNNTRAGLIGYLFETVHNAIAPVWQPGLSGASGVSCIGGGMKRESPHPAYKRPHPRMRCRPGIRLMAHSWQIVSSRAEKTCACRRPSQGSAPAFRSLRRLARPLAGHAGRPLATEGIQGGRLNQAGESAAPLPMPPNRQLSLGRAYRP